MGSKKEENQLSQDALLNMGVLSFSLQLQKLTDMCDNLGSRPTKTVASAKIPHISFKEMHRMDLEMAQVTRIEGEITTDIGIAKPEQAEQLQKVITFIRGHLQDKT